MTEITFDNAVDRIRPVVGQLAKTRLRPEAFFVARYGVLTLAYIGFTVPILDLKSRLDALLPGLPPENPGSMWPKTTLAALGDDQILSADDIVQLREATAEATICLARRNPVVPVVTLDVVELRTRSMERVGRRVPLHPGGADTDSRVPDGHRRIVNTVLTQWRREGLSHYVPDLTRTGHRTEHYRRKHLELSLVIPVGPSVPCLDQFRDAIERRIPDRYTWFDPDSLHITVRSLGGRDEG